MHVHIMCTTYIQANIDVYINHAPRLWHQVCLGGGKTSIWFMFNHLVCWPRTLGRGSLLAYNSLEVRRHSWTWYLGCRLPILAKKWVPLMFSVECADRSLVFTVKLLVLQMSNIYIYIMNYIYIYKLYIHMHRKLTSPLRPLWDGQVAKVKWSPTRGNFSVFESPGMCVYDLEPSDPWFGWKRPCFGRGWPSKNRGQLGSRYICYF